MSILYAVFLGVIQGIAEFLPISSSGHLSVLQNFFKLQSAEQGHLFFDVLLHLGTMISILVVYWKDVVNIVSDSIDFVRSAKNTAPEERKEHPGGRFLLMLIIGTLPLFVIFPFHSKLEQLYYNTWFIGAAFILTGCILYISDRIRPGRKNERTMTALDAIIVGFCQAIATIPGLSRSGCTITGGITTGLNRSFAMKYSLLMSVPAVLGANLLSLLDALKEGVAWSNLPAYLIGTAVAMVVGYFAILLLQRLLNKGKFGKFAYYLWIVGAVVLIVSFF